MLWNISVIERACREEEGWVDGRMGGMRRRADGWIFLFLSFNGKSNASCVCLSVTVCVCVCVW